MPGAPPARLGLAGRLFVAQALVVLTGSVTFGLVASTVGPLIFHDHLRQAVGPVSPAAAEHVEQAYASASLVSTTVGLLVAMVAALAASAYVARRVAQPVSQLAEAASDVAGGHYAVRVAAPGLGGQFDTLAEAFNTMAAGLADVEAARRRMLTDLGHELRTPLATIEAYLDAAEDGVAVDDEDLLTVLRAQTARLRRLAEDLTAVGRAEERQFDLHPVPVSAGDLASTAVAAVRQRFQTKGVGLREIVDQATPLIEADPERIGQVLGNLLDNALRHTPAGGQVTVLVAGDPAGVRLQVSDTGEGIGADHLPHLFERLYRVDSARDRGHGGSGIGLAIVRALVHAHGGRVVADSAGPGTGATFTVTLPAAQPPAGH